MWVLIASVPYLCILLTFRCYNGSVLFGDGAK